MKALRISPQGDVTEVELPNDHAGRFVEALRTLIAAMTIEALMTALSSAEPGRPIDWRTPSRPHALRNRAAVYSLPWSLWKITPAVLPPRTAATIASAPYARSASWCSRARAEDPA